MVVLPTTALAAAVYGGLLLHRLCPRSYGDALKEGTVSEEHDLWSVWLPDANQWLETNEGILRYGYDWRISEAIAHNLREQGKNAIRKRIDTWAQQQPIP